MYICTIPSFELSAPSRYIHVLIQQICCDYTKCFVTICFRALQTTVWKWKLFHTIILLLFLYFYLFLFIVFVFGLLCWENSSRRLDFEDINSVDEAPSSVYIYIPIREFPNQYLFKKTVQHRPIGELTISLIRVIRLGNSGNFNEIHEASVVLH